MPQQLTGRERLQLGPRYLVRRVKWTTSSEQLRREKQSTRAARRPAEVLKARQCQAPHQQAACIAALRRLHEVHAGRLAGYSNTRCEAKHVQS
ncbi:hypothetical protein OEZ86_003891 [Tetradesmus obliquus]|nr:hypothetical protein OEZ86_003891 [Tetradesmus obliquus]